MKLLRTLPALLASLALVACVDNNSGSGSQNPGGGNGGGGVGPLAGCAALNTLDLGPDGSAIVDLDASNLSPIVTDVFDRYTAITTQSGKRIHFVAQAGVSDAKIRRSREILRMQLEPLPGTSAGADKTDVADALSDTCGTVAIFANPSQYDFGNAAVARFRDDFGSAYVPLFGDRIIVEGSPPYMQASPANDETFGATGVLVYRHGLRAERPAWATQLQLAATNALADTTFDPAGPEPYRDLTERYLAILLDSHAGVWGHDPSGDGSAANGLYAFGSRPGMAAGDASTLALIEDFFAAEHTFPAEVDPDFAGNFSLLRNQNFPYTNRSQYLVNVSLTGSNTAELFGSPLGDRLTGNAGNNNIRGRGGDDIIDGGPGLDTAVFGAPRAEFTIINNGDGSLDVRHDVIPGLGTDTVRNIEILNFTDQNVNL